METKVRVSRRLALTYVLAPLFVIAVVFAIAFVLLQSSSSSQSQVNAAPPDQAVTTNFSSSPEWLNAPAGVVKMRQDELAKRANGTSMMPNGLIPSFGPYMTDPVDITHNGDYVIRAGPLRSDDLSKPSGIDWPLDTNSYFDIAGKYQMLNGAKVSDIGGQRFLQFTLTVIDFKKPYVGLRFLLQ
jgi:hypothetical protein